MRKFRFGFVLLSVAAAGLLAIGAGTATAATIKVNTTSDDFGLGATCSLREAVQSANADAAYGGCRAGAGRDEITLRKGATYIRSLDGLGEDGNATGDLDIASKLSIGPRKGKAKLDAAGFDRGIDVLATGDLTLSRVTLTGASETYPPDVVAGMGIHSSGKLETSRVRIAGNETLGNSANNGGGLTVASGVADLDRTTIVGNRADNVGGGVAFYAGVLKISRSSIVDNESGYVGGGLYLGGSPSDRDAVQIRDSTIAGNQADENGGGIYVEIYGTGGGDSDGAKLTNVTVSGNRSNEGGGGVFQSVGDVSLNSVTVTRNVADADASGGIAHGGGVAGSVFFLNSIVFGNRDRNPVDPLPDCEGAGSSGHSVVGRSTGCFKGATDRSRDPKLGLLRRNGGPTATHALKKGSSALGLADKQRSPNRDQRGIKRDKRPDSGAYERR